MTGLSQFSSADCVFDRYDKDHMNTEKDRDNVWVEIPCPSVGTQTSVTGPLDPPDFHCPGLHLSRTRKRPREDKELLDVQDGAR